MQTMWELTLVLLTAIAVSTGAQVNLTYNFRNPTLDIRCSVMDIRRSLSLSLSRLENERDNVMVSMSFTPGAAPVMYDMRGAQVTNFIDADGTSESYINLHWPVATSSLEGDYKCSLAGLDNLYQIRKVDLTKREKLTGLQPVLSASPEEIRVGVTRDFTVRCSFAERDVNNVSQISSCTHCQGPASILSVNLFHVKGDIYDLLATVSFFSPAKVMLPGQRKTVVSGSVNGPQAYLEIGWEHPTHSHAGQYTCGIIALDLEDNPIHFNRTVNVTAKDSTHDELMTTVLMLETDLSNVEADLSHLNSSCQNTSQELTNTKSELVNTSQELTNTRQELTKIKEENAILKSTLGPARCEDANLTTGEHIVRLNPDPQLVDPVDVICQVDDDGKVWTVFQNRFDGSVNFNRTYAEYENGFGTLLGEFWLGLKDIVRLMGDGQCELKADMELNGKNYTRIYPSFDLDPVDYTLSVSGYNDGGLGLSYHNGQRFYTYDRDNSPDCARGRGGGWWYDSCYKVNLNGKIDMHFIWYDLNNNWSLLSRSKMSFRHK